MSRVFCLCQHLQQCAPHDIDDVLNYLNTAPGQAVVDGTSEPHDALQP